MEKALVVGAAVGLPLEDDSVGEEVSSAGLRVGSPLDRGSVGSFDGRGLGLSVGCLEGLSVTGS